MDTIRQQKTSNLIKKELAEIFLFDGPNIYDCMITVTKTTVTKDLSIARSYLSIFNAEDNDVVINTVRANTKDIDIVLDTRFPRIFARSELNLSIIRSQLITPSLSNGIS